MFPYLILAAALLVGGCGNTSASNAGSSSAISSATSRQLTYSVEGRLDIDAPSPAGQRETVTWSSFPTTIDELRDAQRQIGHTMGGAVALQLMAFELYRHDRATGEQAVRLVNHKNNVQSVLSVISQRYSKSAYAPDDDLYVQPYLVASFLKGATTANRYTPDEPYSITVFWDANRQVVEASPYMGGGRLCYVHVENPNYSTKIRSVQVIKTSADAFYLVQNSPALYTQCPPIAGAWTYEMK